MNTAGAFAGAIAPIVTGFIVKSMGSFQIALLIGGVMVGFAALSMLVIVGRLEPIKLPAKYAAYADDPGGKVIAMGH